MSRSHFFNFRGRFFVIFTLPLARFPSLLPLLPFIPSSARANLFGRGARIGARPAAARHDLLAAQHVLAVVSVALLARRCRRRGGEGHAGGGSGGTGGGGRGRRGAVVAPAAGAARGDHAARGRRRRALAAAAGRRGLRLRLPAVARRRGLRRAPAARVREDHLPVLAQAGETDTTGP